jgi:hypothetical protein
MGYGGGRRTTLYRWRRKQSRVEMIAPTEAIERVARKMGVLSAATAIGGRLSVSVRGSARLTNVLFCAE